MRTLLTALALASIVATPALAQTKAHHASPQERGQQLYLYNGTEPVNPGAGPAVQNDPPGVMRRGYLMTDPDPQIRSQLNRGYDTGTTD